MSDFMCAVPGCEDEATPLCSFHAEIDLRAELADARAERLKLHAELNTTQRERDEAQALLERFVHGTTEEELRIHGLASSTALGDMEHRAEDAEAACAAYRDGLERFNGRRIGFGPSLEHRDLHAAQEYAQVLLERPNPGEGWLSPERAREVAEKAVRVERDTLAAKVDAGASVIRELRQKLAIAGVEGSPPPGEETTIGVLIGRARAAESTLAAEQAAHAEAKALLEQWKQRAVEAAQAGLADVVARQAAEAHVARLTTTLERITALTERHVTAHEIARAALAAPAGEAKHTDECEQRIRAICSCFRSGR